MIEGLSMEISLDALRQLNRRMLTMRRLGQDMTPLMERIGFYGENSTKLRFEEEIAPDGSKWLESHRAKVEGGQTLSDSGQLRESFVSEGNRHSAIWGTNKIYAAIHNNGGVIRAKPGSKLAFQLPGVGLMFVDEVTMPKREFMGFNREDELNVLDIAADFFGGPLQ